MSGLNVLITYNHVIFIVIHTGSRHEGICIINSYDYWLRSYNSVLFEEYLTCLKVLRRGQNPEGFSH